MAPSVNSTIEWTIDCGCTTTSMLVEVDAEQLVGLDHLEALVHQRRRVDGDLRAHLQVGWASASLDGDVGQLVAASGRGTGPPLAVSTMRRDLVGGVAGAQALVDGAVLGVDGHELGAGRGPRRAAPPGRRRSATPCWPAPGACPLERGEGDRQAGEADDPVDARRRPRRRCRPARRRRPRTSVPGGTAPRARRASVGVGDGDDARAGAPAACSTSASTERCRAEGDDLVAVAARRATTSSACVPIDPVEPTIATRGRAHRRACRPQTMSSSATR